MSVSRNAGKLRALITACFIIWTCVAVFVPFSPTMPSADLDASWRFGLNQAAEQHLRYGSEISFTFGPYAAVYTGQYSPSTDALMIGSSLLLAAVYATALLALARRGRSLWAIAVVVILSGLYLPRDVLFLSLPLLAALVVEQMTKSNAPSRAPNFGLLITISFALGMLPLIKGTFLIGSVAILGCCVIYLMIRGLLALAVTTAAAFASGVVFFWMIAGQSNQDLLDYLSNLVPMSSGYTEAMATYGDLNQVKAYLIASSVALIVILFDRAMTTSSRFFLSLTYGVYLFTAFKSGFVRHDGHCLIAGVSILLGGAIMLVVLRSRAAKISLIFAFAAWLVVDLEYQQSSMQLVLDNITAVSDTAMRGLKLRLVNSLELRREYDAAVMLINNQAALPLLPGTSDIYSHDQSLLIASGNRWAPRPIFQSYSAYTPAMLEQNRRHLAGSDAPDNIFFKVQPIDSRFPATEDGASWPELLLRYRPVRFEHDTLLLARDADAAGPLLERIGDVVIARRNEQVVIPASKNLVFASIRIKRSWIYYFFSIAYKPAPLGMEITLVDSTHRSFRIVSSMIDSPFLLSPMVANTKDFALLYGDRGRLDSRRLRSFSISTPQTGNLMWAEEFAVDFFSLS